MHLPLSTCGHVVSFCSRVNNLVNRLHGEVERHKLANRSESVEGGSNGDTWGKEETVLYSERKNLTLEAKTPYATSLRNMNRFKGYDHLGDARKSSFRH